jgi:hypothetical protein
MLANSRMIAVLLLCTMTAALPGAQAFALAAAPPAHPAGCHRQGPATPTPAPVSYQCCVNGHHWTIPSASFSTQAPLAEFSRSDGGGDFSLASVLSAHFSMIVVPASSPPPGVAPLRN